jgi:hypothetical protein
MSGSFRVEPHRAVGPVVFGMSRSEVEAAMGQTPERAKRNALSIAKYDYFVEDGFFVYYDPNDIAMAAECFELSGVSYPPDTSLDLSYSDLIAWLQSRDPNLAIEAGGGFRSDALGVAGAPKGEDDKVESLVFYRPNYYEDSARWRREQRAARQ